MITVPLLTEAIATAQVGTISLDQAVDWIQRLGLSGAFALMWWFQRKDTIREREERQRLQLLVEAYLPTAKMMVRQGKALSKVTGAPDDEGEDV